MTGTIVAARLSRIVKAGVLLGVTAGIFGALKPGTVFGAPAVKGGECLSGPKGALPQGERWFYRVERGTKRHCWYTRAGSPHVVAAKRPQVLQPIKTSSPPDSVSEPLLPAVADARAEAKTSVSPPPPLAEAAPRSTPRTVAMDDAARTLAERWFDHESAGQPTASLASAVIRMPPEEPAVDVETNLLGKVLAFAGVASSVAGAATVLIVIFLSLRKSDRFTPWSAQSMEAGSAVAGPAEEPLRTWYEPPFERLRLERQTARLRQPAQLTS